MQLSELASERLKGTSIFVEEIGNVEITKTGIKEILNQPIDKEHLDLKNSLTLILDVLLHNIVSVTEPVLSAKPKEASLGVNYRYVKFKGVPQFTGALRFNPTCN